MTIGIKTIDQIKIELEKDRNSFFYQFKNKSDKVVLELIVDLFEKDFRIEITYQDRRIELSSEFSFRTKNNRIIRNNTTGFWIGQTEIYLKSENYQNNMFKRFDSKDQRNEFILEVYNALEDFTLNWEGFKEIESKQEEIIEVELETPKELFLKNSLDNAKYEIKRLETVIEDMGNEINELEEEYSVLVQKYNEAIIKIDAKEIKINNSAKDLIKKEQNAIIINNENKRLKLKVNQLIDQNKELAQKNNDLKTKQLDSSDLLNNMFNQFFK